MLVLVVVVLVLLVVLLLVVICKLSNDYHLGWISKISHLFGVQLAALENKRFTFYPHDNTKKSDHLIVSFAGGALKVSGIPYTEFRKSLANFECDQLFVMDPTGMTWYLQDPTSKWQGYHYYESKLMEITKNYTKCMFIGNCLGASGALMMSHLATKVVAFNPHVDPSCHNSLKLRLANKLIPKSMQHELYRLIKQNTSTTKASVKVYGAKTNEVTQQTALLPENVQVTLYNGCTNISAYLKKEGKLVQLLSRELTDMIVS